MYIDRRARNNKLKLSGISRNLWISWKFSMLIKLLPQYVSFSTNTAGTCTSTLIRESESGADEDYTCIRIREEARPVAKVIDKI